MKLFSSEYLSNIISISIIVYFIYPFIRYVETSNVMYIWFGIGAFLADGSSWIIKLLTRDLGGALLRPAGAKDCNILCNNGAVSGAPGFPSGHMTTIAFFFTFLYLISPEEKRQTIALVGALATIIMAYARMQKKCHNLLQVLGGVAYGALFAYLWWRLAIKYSNDETQNT